MVELLASPGRARGAATRARAPRRRSATPTRVHAAN